MLNKDIKVNLRRAVLQRLDVLYGLVHNSILENVDDEYLIKFDSVLVILIKRFQTWQPKVSAEKQDESKSIG